MFSLVSVSGQTQCDPGGNQASLPGTKTMLTNHATKAGKNHPVKETDRPVRKQVIRKLSEAADGMTMNGK